MTGKELAKVWTVLSVAVVNSRAKLESAEKIFSNKSDLIFYRYELAQAIKAKRIIEKL